MNLCGMERGKESGCQGGGIEERQEESVVNDGEAKKRSDKNDRLYRRLSEQE